MKVQRRRPGAANGNCTLTLALTAAWTAALTAAVLSAPGVPRRAAAQELEIWDPPAVTVFPDHDRVALGESPLEEMLADGRALFRANFNLADGAGRPASTGDSKPTIRLPDGQPAFLRTAGPDANSCFGCHNQPALGGSGDFAVNVFVGAQFTDPPTRSVDFHVTSERNTIGVFGAGAVEMLAREMTRDLLEQRRGGLEKAALTGRPVRLELSSKGVGFGAITARPNGTFDDGELEGVDPDLVVKPFAAKGVVISLREFTVNALNQHHGIQAVERFGWERTGRRDFDEDGVEVEMTVGQISALTLFQAALPAPVRRAPRDAEERARWARGERLFTQVGCARCHIPRLPLASEAFSEPNPYNRPGNVLPADVAGPIAIPFAPSQSTPPAGVYRDGDGRLWVAVYSDLRRHRICDAEDPFFCNETLRQDFVPQDEFMTAKLWDAGTSMPYGHRGDCSTVSEAIVHHSAEAAASRDAFLALQTAEKRAVVAFLLSLVADAGQSPTDDAR